MLGIDSRGATPPGDAIIIPVPGVHRGQPGQIKLFIRVTGHVVTVDTGGVLDAAPSADGVELDLLDGLLNEVFQALPPTFADLSPGVS